MNNIEKIGLQVLQEVIIAMELEVPYYVKDNFERTIGDTEDSLFITDDEIINYVKKVLADKYTLEVKHVQREYISVEPEDNFFYEDIELKLIKN